MPRACLEPAGGEDLLCHVQACEIHEGMGSDGGLRAGDRGIALSGQRKRGEHVRREEAALEQGSVRACGMWWSGTVEPVSLGSS